MFLNPNENRLFYGKILSPPKDYTLDFAIGTTYSLNLDALVSVSLSLDLSEDMDSDLSDNPIVLVNELRKSSDKIAIFCDSSQIQLPSKLNSLFILVENMVFQVKNKNKSRSRYSSFHPKFWLIKYSKNDGSIFYRLIVLSRNLTFDISWDISFCMDGQRKDNPTDKNDALIDFIDYLIKFTTDENKINKMRKMAEELKFIHFNLESKIFKDFEFYINGIGAYNSIQNSSLYNDNLNELLIVSPFLSKRIINKFNNQINNNALLFTRFSSLSGFKENDCNNFEIYILKEDIINGESAFSEDLGDILEQDIHAKMYFIENKNSSQLYMGSLNASENAFIGNVEFMIMLKAKKSKLNVNQVANDLFNGDKGGPKDPFKLIDINDVLPEESNEKNIDLTLKYISHLNSKAKVLKNKNSYNIELEFENFDFNQIKNCSVFVKPFLSNKECPLSNHIIFENISKINLSEFFIIRITSEKETISRVIKVKTEGMPIDRYEEVISNIITDEIAFIEYIAFLLGDDFIITTIENENLKNSSKSISIDLPELYEKMLKAACHSPEKFDEIDFLISALEDDGVIPDGFKELSNTFTRVIDKNE